MSNYIIRKAVSDDTAEILNCYESSHKIMNSIGNTNQWEKGYPNKETIAEDINNDYLFVVTLNNKIVGTFVFFVGIEPAYNEIFNGKWLNNDKYGVIHRVAKKDGNNGILKAITDYCLTITDNLKIDTHKDNLIMRHLLISLGFTECGIIYIRGGKERIAYQKIKSIV